MVHEPWWTATARHADIVLPATTTLERNDIGCARRDRFIMAMQRAIEPVGEARDDFAIFSALARRLGCAEAYTKGRDEMAGCGTSTSNAGSGAANAMTLPDFDAFWSKGWLEIPAACDEYVLFGEFRADPAKNPLRTPSRPHRALFGENRGLRLRRLPAASGLDRAVRMAGIGTGGAAIRCISSRASRATACTARWIPAR